MSRITALTSAALEKLASGVASNFAGTGLYEHVVNADEEQVHLFYAADDGQDEQLILIRSTDDESVLPAELREHRRLALHRILSFMQRTRSMPMVMPPSWKPYRFENRIAFFALSTGTAASPRWVAQVRLEGTLDVALWGVTTTQDKQTLPLFEFPSGTYQMVRKSWQMHWRDSLLAMQGPAAQDPTGVEVVLDDTLRRAGPSKSRTISEWLPALTSSQKEFVDASSDRSIRLRGPAGSGKTVTMVIKAVLEAQKAKAAAEMVRILFATHSWSLAGEVDDLIRSLSEYGDLDNITVLPLLSVAEEVLPGAMRAGGLELIGDDSLTGKRLQLEQIREVLEDFKRTDWITFADITSEDFRKRLDSGDEEDAAGLAWDLLIEFGCVLGADGIFPGFNAELRYLRLPRAAWMMDLPLDGDIRVVYALYQRYSKALEERNLETSDQLLNDFLNYLENHAWNHRRKREGFDLIFVDEFHLFNIQERQTLRHLSRDTESYPRIFMALDPRQSPWQVHSRATAVGVTPAQDETDAVRTVDIPTVHRQTPQILDLVKHVHLDFPNLDLGDDWSFSISNVESLSKPGPRPSLWTAETEADEEIALYQTISDIYSSSAQFALAIMDDTRFPKYMRLMEEVSVSGKFKIVTITSKGDVGLLRSHKRGVVVGPAEYLAGLQFDTVLIAGVPDMNTSFAHIGFRRRRNLSLLYLALTRASRDVRIFVNEEDGGVPEVLSRARDQGFLGIFPSQMLRRGARSLRGSSPT